jgi:hypothetical protein
VRFEAFLKKILCNLLSEKPWSGSTFLIKTYGVDSDGRAIGEDYKEWRIVGMEASRTSRIYQDVYWRAPVVGSVVITKKFTSPSNL